MKVEPITDKFDNIKQLLHCQQTVLLQLCKCFRFVVTVVVSETRVAVLVRRPASSSLGFQALAPGALAQDFV